MQRSENLNDDDVYLGYQSRNQQKQYAYVTAFPPSLPPSAFPAACSSAVGNCSQKHPGNEAVDVLSSFMVPPATRPNPKPQTELVGGPFKARGDGLLKHTDTYNRLVGNTYNPRCGSKRFSERDPDRWQCISAPLATEDPRQFGFPRGGLGTRVGPAYFSCL